MSNEKEKKKENGVERTENDELDWTEEGDEKRRKRTESAKQKNNEDYSARKSNLRSVRKTIVRK